MLCPNCSSENVLLEDGQFFCGECASQQVAAREEAVVEENLNISRRNVVGTTTSDESSLDASSVSSTGSNACSIYECYNILLYKQVSALIHLGVSEKLKDVVLFIWKKYLQKCEAAFMEENDADQEKTKDIESNNMIFPYNPQSERKAKKNNKNQDTNELNSDSDAGVPRNDSMEVDEPSRAAFFSQSKNFWSHYEAGGKKSSVDRMTISKTLCFCYLGLLYIQDRLLLTDFLRLVQEERVPYLNTTSFIPHSMLIDFPLILFNEKNVPDVSMITGMCSKLIPFLQLPKFNHRSLIPIALKFVKDLNLPDNIIHIAKMLLDKSNERTKHWKLDSTKYALVPMYEVQAIALIIVVLKMFYVLDGEYEVNHCEISRKINFILQDRRLFVWDQWKKQASLKEYLFFKPNSRCSKVSLYDSLSASQIISKYSASHKDVSVISKDRGNQKRVNSAKQNILNVFNSLRSGKEAIPETPAPTSFPLTQNLSDFMENWKNLHIYKETEEIDFLLLTENFSSDILFYKPSSNEDESSKEIIELLCDSLYKPVPYMDGTVPDAFQTSSIYWHKDYTRYDSDWLNSFSPSFRWLLKFMSKYLNTNCQVVYIEVLRLERRILPPRHRMRELT